MSERTRRRYSRGNSGALPAGWIIPSVTGFPISSPLQSINRSRCWKLNSPLLTTLLLSAAGSGAGGYELFLNRIGINSIDIPREKVLAEPGTGLVLRFLNRGAPIHITVTSANASMYTDFFHENMYIVDEAVLSIPIRKESGDGTFDLEIIARLWRSEGGVTRLCPEPAAHAAEGAGRIPAAASCPGSSSPADGYHGDRAYPVLGLDLHDESSCSILYLSSFSLLVHFTHGTVTDSPLRPLFFSVLWWWTGFSGTRTLPFTRLRCWGGSSGGGGGRTCSRRESSGLPAWCSGSSPRPSLPCRFILWKRLPPGSCTCRSAAVMLKSCFAWRSLEEHTLAVMAALKDGVGNGREKVKLLVSRETAQLDRRHILSAGFESMTENLTDSIVSPLLFFSVFGLARSSSVPCREYHGCDGRIPR